MNTEKVPPSSNDSLDEQVRKINLEKIGEISKIENLSSDHTERGIIAVIIAVLTVLTTAKIEASMVPGLIISLEMLRQFALARKYDVLAKEKWEILDPYLDLLR
jgi:hypothetical protein